MPAFVSTTHRYRPLNRNSVRKREIWQHIPPDAREAVRVVSTVLPFRVNGYVTRELIEWDRIPHDPMFQLTFPQRDMLDPDDFAHMQRLLDRDAPPDEIRAAANRIRLRLNPSGCSTTVYLNGLAGSATVTFFTCSTLFASVNR